MRTISRLLAAAFLMVVMAAPTVADEFNDSPVNVVATFAGAQFHTYSPPVVVTQKGGRLTYLNFDIVQHDVVQDPRVDGISGPKKKPWCTAFKKGACPVFWTPKIGVAQQTDVLGLESVKPGQIYSFYCTLHASMKGKLVVAP